MRMGVWLKEGMASRDAAARSTGVRNIFGKGPLVRAVEMLCKGMTIEGPPKTRRAMNSRGLEGLLDGRGKAGIVGSDIRAEARENFTIAANQKLLEVPEELRRIVGAGKVLALEKAGKIVAQSVVIGVARGPFGDELMVEGMFVGTGDCHL